MTYPRLPPSPAMIVNVERPIAWSSDNCDDKCDINYHIYCNDNCARLLLRLIERGEADCIVL